MSHEKSAAEPGREPPNQAAGPVPDERVGEQAESLQLVRRDRDAAVERLAVVSRQASRRRERLVEELVTAEVRVAEAGRKLENARRDLDRVRSNPIVRLGLLVGGSAAPLRSWATRSFGRAGRAGPADRGSPSNGQGSPAAVSRVDAAIPQADGPVSVAIHIAAQTWAVAEGWGDTAFARSLQEEFIRRGWPATVHVAAEATAPEALQADVALHLFGSRVPPVRPGQVSVLWVISHPDRVSSALCAAYDVVFVASESLSKQLAEATSVPVLPLLQATDPARFHPAPDGPRHEVLFVGNSRGVRRPILDALAPSTHDLAVYGGGWTPKLLDPSRLRGRWIPNEELHRYYSGADIVLSDHWRDMREEGLISNRVFDALASGAFVISDRVLGLDEAFDGAVVTWDLGEDLPALVDYYLARPEERRARAEKGRAAVLERHTFAKRVDAITEVVRPFVARRDRGSTGPGRLGDHR